MIAYDPPILLTVENGGLSPGWSNAEQAAWAAG